MSTVFSSSYITPSDLYLQKSLRNSTNKVIHSYKSRQHNNMFIEIFMPFFYAQVLSTPSAHTKGCG